MTLAPRIPRIQRCRISIMVNARKHSTEHTWNMLSIQGVERLAANGRADQTAYKPGSVPPDPRRTLEPDAATIPLDRPLRDGSRDQPGRLGPTTALPACAGAESLFGLAPGGACRAVDVAANAVRSYRTLSPLPPMKGGGLLSVALSLGSPPAGVTRRHVVVEPGLSSTVETAAAAQPSDPRRSVGAPPPAVKGVSRWECVPSPARSGDFPGPQRPEPARRPTCSARV
jgi:hypothetical protein